VLVVYSGGSDRGVVEMCVVVVAVGGRERFRWLDARMHMDG
jgi:hypothetical protein